MHFTPAVDYWFPARATPAPGAPSRLAGTTARVKWPYSRAVGWIDAIEQAQIGGPVSRAAAAVMAFVLGHRLAANLGRYLNELVPRRLHRELDLRCFEQMFHHHGVLTLGRSAREAF